MRDVSKTQTEIFRERKKKNNTKISSGDGDSKHLSRLRYLKRRFTCENLTHLKYSIFVVYCSQFGCVTKYICIPSAAQTSFNNQIRYARLLHSFCCACTVRTTNKHTHTHDDTSPLHEPTIVYVYIYGDGDDIKIRTEHDVATRARSTVTNRLNTLSQIDRHEGIKRMTEKKCGK